VVPSPKPLRSIEADIVRRLLDLGVIVIAAGGGGIPVTESNGALQGVEAMIGRDLAAALLDLSLPVVQARYRFVVREGIDLVAAVLGLLPEAR
jgi:carbamate kinase